VRDLTLLLPLQSPLGKSLRMWFLYKTWIGQLLLRLPLTWWILTWQHHRIARYADSTDSKKSIKPFIKVSLLLHSQLS
jgi:phosphatidylserine decarboxylase